MSDADTWEAIREIEENAQIQVDDNQAKLLELLQAAVVEEQSGGAMTSREISEALGVSQRTARIRIRKGLDSGLIEHCKVPRVSISDCNYLSDGYRIKT